MVIINSLIQLLTLLYIYIYIIMFNYGYIISSWLYYDDQLWLYYKFMVTIWLFNIAMENHHF